MAKLGTRACVELCRHCTYAEIYVDEMLAKGEAPLSYDTWLEQVWFPFLAEELRRQHHLVD